MEMELEPRVKPLTYKVKAMSRESPAQKAAHVLDTDLRNHWSTATNTKEWILLELDEPALLSHLRIYNKSVLEWEVSVGLRYKPETFVKVRPRSEAPRRDMTYPMNYTPCRYVRISCMRGNPIAIFFIQLIGISVVGLEPEFQSVVNYLLPHITSQKLDAGDMHLQLLQDVTSRLARFLPQLEVDLNGFPEAAEPTLRFLAMLAGPFYPILQIVTERESAKLVVNVSDYEATKTNLSSTALTVSSNFEPRRSRNVQSGFLAISSHVVFRSDAIFMLLRKAYKDSNLGNVCRMVSRILSKISEPPNSKHELPTVADEAPKSVSCHLVSLTDYSNLFGEEFQIPDDMWDLSYLNVLDNTAVEEGLMHVLYASASQPLHCSKLAETTSDLWLMLPLVQALLPALRPIISSPYQIDDKFSLWKQPFVQNAMSQIVATSSSSIYHPLLRACAGYLSSFSPSHAKAACVLIDLCSGVLAPWMGQVIAKVDLTVELLEDFFGVIQGARLSFPRARAAIKYIVLALSGNMDDIMAKYKDAKQRILFLVEMLEPFLYPAITPPMGMIAFGKRSPFFAEDKERNCAIALNVLRTAVRKSAVLPSLEAAWRRGSVSPSVLLSVLDTQMQLPPDIDQRKFFSSYTGEPQSSTAVAPPSCNGASFRSNDHENTDVKVDDIDTNGKMDVPEDASLLFAPPELNRMSLSHVSAGSDISLEVKNFDEKKLSNNAGLDAAEGTELYNLLADYSQLMNYRDCELKADEFRRLALDLNSRGEINQEGQDVAIDALLLAAECYIIPRFMMSSNDISPHVNKISSESNVATNSHKIFRQKDIDLKMVADIERKRDRVVLEILIEAAELDRTYRKSALSEEMTELYVEEDGNVVNLSQEDILSADAVTLVRQNQSLLCNFLIQRLQRDSLGEQNSTYEILMWCLLFLLHSATKLSCSPEHVVDVILKFAEYINLQLKLFHYQFKEGNSQLNMQRRWNLLQKLVVASSGSDERSELSVSVRNDFRFSNLIPPRVWLLKIPTFSSSAFPLVRYFGWMAVARNAEQYLKERLLLVSDLSQLTHLLSIFSDDLSLVDDIIEHKDFKTKIEEVRVHPDISIVDGDRSYGHQDAMQSFRVIYPDISKFFPNLKKEFEAFGETILEAVGVQIKFLSTTVVPDLICWFSDLCSWSFVQGEHESNYFRGFVAKNAKAVILYVFEAIVVEHMEAMVPEIPRVVQVLVSLCSASYCDVSLLDSILRLLKPIIVYYLGKVPDEEKQLVDESCENFESLCFGKLFNNIKENQSTPNETGNCPALTIFVLATIFGDLSFHRKTEVLQSTLLWAEFASFEGTTVFHDYLCAYQVLMDNCKDLMIGTLRVREIIPLKMSYSPETSICTVDDFPKVSSWFLCDILNPSPPTEIQENPEKYQDGDDVCKVHQLTWEEIKSLSKDVEALISKLNPTMERCWKVHHKLAKKLALINAECFVLSRCLFSFAEKDPISGVDNPSKFIDEFVEVCRTSLEGLAKMIFVLQENHCWEVAFVLIYSILEVPQCFRLDKVIGDICSAIEIFSNSAPNITWRLQTDKMISLLLTRNIHENFGTEVPLSDLFSALLGHPEPEQRYIALKHLGRILGQDIDSRLPLSSTNKTVIEAAELKHSSSEVILSRLVSATWDQVTLMASSDTSLLLRIHATALLISFIPFAERGVLQSFLAAADSILQCLTTLEMPTSYGPLTQFSLALIASVCLYSPAEDISLIPETIWRNIETRAVSRNDKYCTGLEKKACEALCRVKNDGDQAKQLLKEVLSSSSPKHEIPDFVPTRESILKVIGNLTSARSYFDFFAKEVDQKIMELEEAEMEKELLQREHLPSDSSLDFRDWRQLPFLSRNNVLLSFANAKDDHRLQQIKDEIKSIEKEKLRQEIVARRQQKLLLRRSRQQLLEDAALREADLLQKLDRERINEVEKDLERLQLLELERAKTKELRHNLDIEKEKQAQRELQRELEQVESGIRPSRREFASSSQSRPRDRHRERENDREVNNEGNLRTSTRTIQRDSVSTNTSTPTVVLSGTRSFSTQPPTILQSRERSDDCNSSYEENFDGSRDSGDTGSVGDPDTASVLEGQSNGLGPGQRHGSRGGKSRQIVERREREGRREGKWERKQ